MDDLKPAKTSHPKQIPTPVLDTAIRLGLIAIMVYLALRVFSPFLGLMVWALILAIALYPLNTKLAAKLGGHQGRAATLLVLVVVLLVGVPTVLLGISLVDHMLSAYQSLEDGSLTIRGPGPNVAQWPLVGEQIHATWEAASNNLTAFIAEHQQQLRDASRRTAAALGGVVTTLLGFLAAFIVAGVMLAYAHPGAASTRRIFTRVCGPTVGPEMHTLTVATVRSVATGVIGVAFIQAVLLGIGFLLAGIPAAGLLALGVLVLGIMQLPAALFVIPVVAWLWMAGDGSALTNVLLTVYLILAGLADNILKPILLGRGVAAPMPVVLLGALGGMMTSGLIGLFVGAVILAVSYQIFMAWVDTGPDTVMGESPSVE
ncbi:AI-2E family transporter [Aestuariicella hydrocarbonica]|uniref:AI-2E family transporter n=1 Tax=Pseudomaricurvus hydrocarbonicus TaxID=1470433 RepID=A0A9E5T2K0_9GAMM|nr:AI-2E family transporter [Aestuariicella hydrocarbonica]NHO67921.1 AI-2E family transporter [Aestuariicella hydrocarbonica]